MPLVAARAEAHPSAACWLVQSGLSVVRIVTVPLPPRRVASFVQTFLPANLKS
jgi:hypothetical protein